MINVKSIRAQLDKVDFLLYEINYIYDGLTDKAKSRPLTEKEQAEKALLEHLLNIAD